MQVDKKILARVYSFDLQFEGGKRTSFYRKLFGFKSKTTRENKKGEEKVYENFYPGILTPIPHLRLGKSVIAVPKTAEGKMDEFFENSRWGPIDLYSFDGIIPSRDRHKAMKETMKRVEIRKDRTLESELESLLSLHSKGQLESAEKPRVRRVLEEAKRLMKHDWTENSEFSEDLKNRIEPLEKWIS